MDFQTADRNGMLLKYVCSYVSKTHDAFSSRSLYSTYVSPLQASYRHIAEMTPCQHEIWMSLSAMKISWTCSQTKQYTPPISSTAEDNSAALKYRERPNELEALSFSAWLEQLIIHHKLPSNTRIEVLCSE